MKLGLKRMYRGLAVAFAAVIAVSANISAERESIETFADGAVIVKTPLITQKIKRDEAIDGLPSGNIEISAAKGETDSGQFIVNSTEKISSYDVSISDFSNGENTISASNVEICKQVYTYCKTTIAHAGALSDGYYPDALIPISYVKTAGEDVISAGDNQGFWLNVSVPIDAVAGDYSAMLTFSYNDGKTQQIPVKLTVYDFVLDSIPTFHTSFSIWEDWLAYGELNGGEEKHIQYYDFLLKYNVEGGMLPNETPEQFVYYMRKYYDKVPSFRLPYVALSNTVNDWEYMEKALRLIIDACLEDEINYFSKAYWRLSTFYDEYKQISWREPLVRPMIEGTDKIEEKVVADYVKRGLLREDGEIATSIVNLRHHMTAVYDEKFADLQTITCPLYNELWYTEDIEEVKEHLENDDAVFWSYGCVMSDYYPSPTWQINDYTLSTREMLWFDYENDIVGNLFWNVNGYCNWSNTTEWGYEIIPDLYETGTHDNLSNGDGYLLYPGAPYGSEYPFASIRLATYRDGVDDHTYMSQLARLYQNMTGYGEDYTTTDAKGLVSFLNQQTTGRNTSKLNYQGVLDNKQTLASAIEMAEKNGLVIDKLQVIDNQIEYSFYAPNGVTLALNATDLTGQVSGAGKHYTGSVEIPDNQSLVLSVDGEIDGEVSLITIPKATLITDFMTSEEVNSNVYIPALKGTQDTAVLNTEREYAVEGSSAKITLFGRNDSENIIKTYTPKFGLNMTNWGIQLKDTWSIEFDIFNPTDKDLPITIYLEGKSGEKIDYDKLVLRAGEWRTIVVDNFNVIQQDQSQLAKYQKYLMIKFGNLLDEQKQPYSIDLYIDNVRIRKK